MNLYEKIHREDDFADPDPEDSLIDSADATAMAILPVMLSSKSSVIALCKFFSSGGFRDYKQEAEKALNDSNLARSALKETLQRLHSDLS